MDRVRVRVRIRARARVRVRGRRAVPVHQHPDAVAAAPVDDLALGDEAGGPGVRQREESPRGVAAHHAWSVRVRIWVRVRLRLRIWLRIWVRIWVEVGVGVGGGVRVSAPDLSPYSLPALLAWPSPMLCPNSCARVVRRDDLMSDQHAPARGVS